MGKKLKDGDKSNSLSLREFNRHVDVADWYFRNKARGEGGELPQSTTLPTVIVKVKNNSGGDWARGSVVQLGAWLPTDEDLLNHNLWFAADDPDDAGAVHAIMRHPIEDGKIGEAQLLGVVIAKVNVNDVGHKYAEVIATQTELNSTEDAAPYRIIHAPGTGSQLCVVLIDKAEAGEPKLPIRFKLTATLDSGVSYAAAVIRTFNGTVYADGDPIIVVDWWAISGGGRGHWAGIAGHEGWAVEREAPAGLGANPEYDIIWMEQYARYIEGELDEDMGYEDAGVTEGTVTRSWDGTAPPETVTLLDTDDKFPRALAGAKFTAIRDEQSPANEAEAPRYRLVECQQMSKHAYAVATEASTTGGDVVDITDFAVTDFSPNNLTPAADPADAVNVHGLPIEVDDQVTLEWDEEAEFWVIQQVDYRATSGEVYRTALGRISVAAPLPATDLSTNPGNIIPATGTSSDSTVPLSSVGSCAVYWPHINGSAQVVVSRNLLANKTFYNATPFEFDASELVWVEEMPLQSGATTSRDVDTSLGKIWLVRGFHRKSPYALLTANGWASDDKITWSIHSQVGGLVSLADSNKNVVLDCPVYQYPFEISIHGDVCAELDESVHTHQDFTITAGGTWALNGSNVTRVVQGWRVNQGNDPFTTNGPSPDVTGAASAGTAHTHSLSTHTHTVDSADMALTVRPDNRNTSFATNPGTTIPVSMKGIALGTAAQVFNLTIASGQTITSRYTPSTGVGTLSLFIKPLFGG